MRHLIYVIVFTGRFDDMREFYEKGLALPVRSAQEDWVGFDTAGAALALHRMDDPRRQGIMLRFEADDLDATRADLAARGIDPANDITTFESGRVSDVWDPDGNLISLLEPATPVPSGAGERLTTVILNVADMAVATDFYRDRFGLPAIVQSPWWTEFDTGVTRLSLHPRVPPAGELQHNAQAVVVGFAPESLDEKAEELAERGLEFSAGPVDERHGRFAEIEDPDGNVVLFRESGPRHTQGLHELVESIEDEEEAVPHHAGMRPPLHKAARATSRVAVKPAYKAKKRAKAAPTVKKTAARKPAGRVAAVKKAAARSPRARARNVQAEKSRPAIGRQRKAERRTLERKKKDVAATSRRKPIKRAVAKRRPARGAGRTRRK